jgi:CheY-like chemotaxis protein
LGLSIVKDLVQLQNGEIEADSEPGKGARFRIVIPYEIAADKLPVTSMPEEISVDRAGFQHLHILVVEDNVMNQKLLGHLLTSWNLPFDMVNNGIEAIESLKAGKYDLVLMDIQMPGMDGYTAARDIRQKLNLAIPIIAMTAHAFAGEREKCLSYGMNDYIAKPINEEELGRLVRAYSGIAVAEQDFKKQMVNEPAATYQFINLQYMRDISDGNEKFERSVTEQFIEAIPLDIDALESACAMRDLSAIRQIAHNMKTDISIMGLSEKLSSHLDELESLPFDEAHFQHLIVVIKSICQNAMMEARQFYYALSQPKAVAEVINADAESEGS